MDKRFEWMEVVKVTGDYVVPKVNWRLDGQVGFVAGWSDPDEKGRRDWAVHFNTYGETIGVPDENLESLGRIADESEIVTCSRAHAKRRRKDDNEPSVGENNQA
jgi:hypothetical protein